MILLGLGACAPRVHLRVVAPAEVPLPAEVRRVAVASPASGPGAAEAVAGLVEALNASGRFDARPLEGAAAPATPGEAEGLAVAAGAQALVVLEAWAPESRVVVEPLSAEPGAAGAPRFDGRRESRVTTTWRLYGPGGAALDALEGVFVLDVWSAAGDTAEAAEAGLPPEEQTLRELGGSAGWAYARRISPTWTEASRPYYASGDPLLRAARRAVRAGDWNSARTIWRELSSASPEDAVRARAEHDLAVAAEVHGEYRLALGHAERAVALDGAPRMVRYRELLEGLRARQRTLRRPLAPEPGEG